MNIQKSKNPIGIESIMAKHMVQSSEIGPKKHSNVRCKAIILHLFFQFYSFSIHIFFSATVFQQFTERILPTNGDTKDSSTSKNIASKAQLLLLGISFKNKVYLLNYFKYTVHIYIQHSNVLRKYPLSLCLSKYAEIVQLQETRRRKKVPVNIAWKYGLQAANTTLWVAISMSSATIVTSHNRFWLLRKKTKITLDHRKDKHCLISYRLCGYSTSLIKYQYSGSYHSPC